MAVILQINRYSLISCIVIILSWYLVQISISVIFLVFHSTITGTAIGWFLVTCPWIKSMFSRSWYIKQCTPLGIHYSTWSKHGGKWRDRRWEKHCQFSFLWMNTTTPTWSLRLKERFFKVITEEKQQQVEEKDGNMRKVLCKSFIQWFW